MVIGLAYGPREHLTSSSADISARSNRYCVYPLARVRRIHSSQGRRPQRSEDEEDPRGVGASRFRSDRRGTNRRFLDEGERRRRDLLEVSRRAIESLDVRGPVVRESLADVNQSLLDQIASVVRRKPGHELPHHRTRLLHWSAMDYLREILDLAILHRPDRRGKFLPLSVHQTPLTSPGLDLRQYPGRQRLHLCARRVESQHGRREHLPDARRRARGRRDLHRGDPAQTERGRRAHPDRRRAFPLSLTPWCPRPARPLHRRFSRHLVSRDSLRDNDELVLT